VRQKVREVQLEPGGKERRGSLGDEREREREREERLN
jgi:hypothetical protein